MSALTDLFCALAEIPSPSMEEDAVADKIVSLLDEYGIPFHRDAFGNVYGKIEATDTSKRPLMLSAHMDVVGDTSPVNLVISDTKIETDKTRTLGADDKAGLASALLLGKTVVADKSLKHGGLELVFTRDEEQGMAGAKAVEFNKLNSEYILVLDTDHLGDFLISGAGYTKLVISVKGLKGGHSGIDIADESRVNAVKILAEIVAAIPQGVYREDKTGVITSINVGAIVGGGVKNTPTDKQGRDFAFFLVDSGMSNIINTDAFVLYSIRSSDVKAEAELTKEINAVIDDFNQTYAGKIEVTAKFEEHLKPFERSNDNTMLEIVRKAAENSGVELEVSSFHAGAETHIYAHQKNAKGQTFKPYLLGTANIHNMHSSDEYVEIDSMEMGYEFLKEVFFTFNKD